MIMKYTIKLYERIATSTERKLLIEEDESSEVFVREREKGVDVSLAVEVTKVICKAVENEENEKTHIVLVSGDSDFRPVIEYAVENKVSVDVWAWEAGVSAIYKEFLQQNLQSGVRLFYLDRYLYQLGFVYRPRNFVCSQQCHVFPLHHRFEIIFRDTDKSRGDGLSHYTLSERLTRYTNSIKEYDEELKQLEDQLEKCRRSEQDTSKANTQELARLRLEDDFLPRDKSPLLRSERSLYSEEQKSRKSKMKELRKKPQNVASSHSKKINQILILIEQRQKNRQRLVEEHQEKKKNKEALDFETYHFKIYWKKGFFTIGFCDEPLRSAFLAYLENSKEELRDQLKKYAIETRVVSDDEIRQKAEKEKREAKQIQELTGEDTENDDDGIEFRN